MNKIILKFKFLSDKSVSICLVYVDDVVLAKEGNVFISHYDTDENFIIYSTNNSNFAYTVNALKLPSLNRYEACETLEMNFKSNEEMKTWMKKLYKTLHRWDKLPEFQKRFRNVNINNKVKMENDFWIL